MDEDETENRVEHEVAPPVENENVQDKVENEEPRQSQEDVQERNWKAIRQKQADLERQLREKDEFIQKVILSQQPQVLQKNEEVDLAPDEYANYGGVHKVAQKTVQPLEQKLKQLEDQIAYQNFLKEYPDYEQTVTKEALSLLEQEKPKIAEKLLKLKDDPLAMATLSYEYIKAYNIGDKLPQARRVREVEKKLEKSSKTVQSPLAYDKRPMAQAFRETDADRKAIYEEMMGFAAGSGFGY
jgi:hypothetical protein